MDILYKPEGVCTRYIEINIEDKDDKNESILSKVTFIGGCPGNSIGLANAMKGKTVKEVYDTLKGIKCGDRKTSCPDQLSKALEDYLNNKERN